MTSACWRAFAACTVLAGLAACGGGGGDGAAAKRAEAPAYRGAGNPYVAGDWSPGDAKSWEEHMRKRAQYGQNEYSRSGGS